MGNKTQRVFLSNRKGNGYKLCLHALKPLTKSILIIEHKIILVVMPKYIAVYLFSEMNIRGAI
jgi:hypothetical protein